MSRVSRSIPIVLLLTVTAIWGWTFVVVRDAVQQYSVMPFLALRFTLAALLLAPAVRARPMQWRAGVLPGVALAAGYILQTVGLRYTTASKAGLLTGLFVVFTPLLVFALHRVRPSAVTASAVTLALVGTFLLTSDKGGWAAGSGELFGDLCEVLTAVSFSIHIVLLSRAARRSNAVHLALVQMLVVAVISLAVSAGSGGLPPPSPDVWRAVVITGALASALAFFVQTYVQQRVSPTRTAVILVAEPAFATLFGVLLAGDHFTALQAAGAFLIVVALLVHEAFPLVGPAASRSAAM